MLRGYSLSYEHANGDVLFTNLNFNIPAGRSGLVGANGVGKSLFAQLLAGAVIPHSGTLKKAGVVFYLAQISERPRTRIAEWLAPLREAPFSRQTLIAELMGDLPMDAHLNRLSGGEWMRVRLAQALSHDWDFLILDEPTNNLDETAREQVVQILKKAEFNYLVISHDRHLLRQVDRIYELSNQGLQLYGGHFDFYAEQKRNERDRNQEIIRSAELTNKKREAERTRKMQTQEKRTRQAQKNAPCLGLPRIIIGMRKRQAQKTASKIKAQEDLLVAASTESLSDAIRAQKKEKRLYFEIPETQFPNGKILLRLGNFNFQFKDQPTKFWRKDLNISLTGPSRLALRGPNGSGKSTLLKILLGQAPDVGLTGHAELAKVPWAYLDQNYAGLDLTKTILENVADDSRYDRIEIRNLLARFLFQKDQVNLGVESLSGGERMRACLAKALLSRNAPQILILDEPTNHLDLESIEFLERILSPFQGALIVISHDEDFLKNVGCNEHLRLET